MKSNDFRHLCDNAWKKTISKKLDRDVSIVSSNNESEKNNATKSL